MATGRKTGGRQKGTKNKAAVARETIQQVALAKAVSELTEAEIRALTPMQIMETAATLFAIAGKWGPAASIAAQVAPYRYAKLAPAAPAPPPEDLAAQALALHRLLIEMDETIGADTPLGATTPA